MFVASRRSLLLPGFLLATLVALLSCQQSSSTGPQDNRPFVVAQTSPMDSIRMPDSATWSHKGAIGTFSLNSGMGSFQLKDSFPEPIVSDTLVVSLWTLGMRTTITPVTINASGGFVKAGGIDIDSTVVKLLISFDSLRNTDHSQYGSSSDPVAAQILSLQKATATLILSNKRSIRSLPKGLDSTAVVTQILVLGSKNANIAVLAKITGLDTTSLQTLTKALLQSGVLNSADSTALFPTKPDTADPVVKPLAGTQDTSVSWSTTTYSLAWLVTDDSALESVRLNDSVLTGSNGIFQKTVTLKVGRDTFDLLAKDVHGRVSRSRVVVTRLMDSTLPVIALVTPPKDTSVSNEVQNMDIEVSAFDSVGIDSVKINGVKTTSPPYKASVPLAIGPNAVNAQAWDKAGNVSKTLTVVITRADAPGDTTPPQIRRTSPIAKDTTVDYLTSTVSLSYQVTDDSLASVTLDGKLLASTSSLYQTMVDLPVGSTEFVLSALDKHGNPARDTVKIVRRKDTTKPVATRQGGTKDTSVWAFVPSVPVTWNVTDNALKLVTINGAPVTGASELYSQTVSLAVDTTWIRLMALDSSGNTIWDSVRVVRKYDKTAPEVAFQKAKSRLVANSVTADTLIWTISDNLKMGSVKVNGTTVPPTGTTYTYIIPNLAVGTHRYALVATDSAGNPITDNVLVARTALPPTHSAAEGRYIGTVYDTLTSPGADSIVYSTDLSSWMKVAGAVLITQSKTVYAKAYPGEQIASVGYIVSQIKAVGEAGNMWLSSRYSLYLMENGDVWAAGSNGYGNFGFGTIESGTATTPSKAPFSATAIAVAAPGNGGNSFFRSSNGSWFGAGGNFDGSLGVGSTTTSSPLAPLVIQDVTQITSNPSESYFIKADGTVWGVGNLSIAGAGSQQPTDGNPVVINGLNHIKEVHVSGLFNCEGCDQISLLALDSAGVLWKWISQEITPTQLATGIQSISFGRDILALMKDGTVSGIGQNSHGEIGNGSTTPTGMVFSPTRNLSNIVSIATAPYHSLFLRNDGTLYLSGIIPTTTSGYGDFSDPIFTVPFQLDTDVVAIWRGDACSYFKKIDGTLWFVGMDPISGNDPPAGTPRRLNF